MVGIVFVQGQTQKERFILVHYFSLQMMKLQLKGMSVC